MRFRTAKRLAEKGGGGSELQCHIILRQRVRAERLVSMCIMSQELKKEKKNNEEESREIERILLKNS